MLNAAVSSQTRAKMSIGLSLEELVLMEWPDNSLEHQHFFKKTLNCRGKKEAGGS